MSGFTQSTAIVSDIRLISHGKICPVFYSIQTFNGELSHGNLPEFQEYAYRIRTVPALTFCKK